MSENQSFLMFQGNIEMEHLAKWVNRVVNVCVTCGAFLHFRWIWRLNLIECCNNLIGRVTCYLNKVMITLENKKFISILKLKNLKKKVCFVFFFPIDGDSDGDGFLSV